MIHCISRSARRSLFIFTALAMTWPSLHHAAAQETAPTLEIERIEGVKPRNVIFILVDDHRYDAMGFMGHPFLETPHMDAMARQGVHYRNAFVTTSLCSPSRASILTGQYMHNHRVVDNNDLVKPGTVFFPQYLQKAGYKTAFVGKWHMGHHNDDPRPGFDHWVSFRGQGHYTPHRSGLNVNGERVPQKGYITDELTDYALDWLSTHKEKDGDKPFFLYLSHKAVHADFTPAARHKGRYADVKYEPPATQANTEENYRLKPLWVKNQRNSWHGVDFPYHGLSADSMEALYNRYCESLLAVDDCVGRVMQWLRDNGQYEDTLVIYMGDNGFLWGEHGLIDKRNAYAESMRVPMMASCPALFKSGKKVEGIVANVDIGPTILAAAGVKTPQQMDGRSFLGLTTGEVAQKDWRQELLYEYYWEWNFPQTPTTFALRTDQYKFIQYHGIWDIDELYDVKADPRETKNLIFDPKHKDVVRDLRARLHKLLVATDGNQVPFGFKRGHGQSLRRISGSDVAEFPPEMMREKDGRK